MSPPAIRIDPATASDRVPARTPRNTGPAARAATGTAVTATAATAGERLELRRVGGNRARCARIGRDERHVMAAAGGDLDAEDGGHEHHGDERQPNSPHERLRSLRATAGISASSASPAATRKEVRNALVAARLS